MKRLQFLFFGMLIGLKNLYGLPEKEKSLFEAIKANKTEESAKSRKYLRKNQGE